MRYNILWILSKKYLRISLHFSTYINNKEVTVNLIKKRGQKYTYLRIKSYNQIVITSNLYFSKTDAKLLIKNKLCWLEKNLEQINRNFLNDDEYLYLGIKYKNIDGKNIDLFYKDEAKKIIPNMVYKYASIMNLKPNSIKFRKNKRVWGSCNYKNDLNFNILLMKFPISLIEYVVIHELAHIKHKNHSKSFWNFVEIYCKDYKQRIKEFKSLL